MNALVLGNPPKAATVKLEVMVLDMLLDSIESSPCGCLMVGLLLFSVSVVRHGVERFSIVTGKKMNGEKMKTKKVKYVDT